MVVEAIDQFTQPANDDTQSHHDNNSSKRRPHHAPQTLAVLSLDAVRMRPPSGLKTADVTRPLWPWSVVVHSPVSVRQTFAVPSTGAVRIRPPWGLKTAEFTQPR